MKKAVIELDNSQLLSALEQLPPNDLKNIIDKLFCKGLFRKPEFEDVSKKTRNIVSKEGLKPEIVEEAVQWAKKQK